MKDTLREVVVDVFLMLVFLALGVKIWGSMLEGMKGLIPLEKPYLWSSGFMLSLNAGHFFLGLFHTDDDFSGIHARGMMTSALDYQRIIIRIIAILTISPSVYLRQAVVAYRARKER
ncbi:MAG TPA: hypothetical protein VM492_04225 [Sumerlaeia bacterium]|nr:hypothetical protein [Sumerlaeia bacterium]